MDTYTLRLESIKLLKEWTTWLVAIQTAAIGAIGAGFKDVAYDAKCDIWGSAVGCVLSTKLLASAVVVLFGISIVSALYLLLALPAAVLQLANNDAPEDIYQMRTNRGHRLVSYVRIERWTSMSGFIFLALLIFLIVWTRRFT